MEEEIKRILWEQQERKKEARSKEIEDIVMKEGMRVCKLRKLDLKFDPRWVSEIRDSLPNGVEEKLITWAIGNRATSLRIVCNKYLTKKLLPISENIKDRWGFYSLSPELIKEKMDLLNKAREEFNSNVSAVLGNSYFKSFLLIKAIDLGIYVPDSLLSDPLQWGIIRGCSVNINYELDPTYMFKY